MESPSAIAISSAQYHHIQELLARWIPNTPVWVYGSRVTGTSQAHSDLDMVVFADAQQKLQIFCLKEAFEESDLPFRVDLFVWKDIPAQFQKNIMQNHVVLVGGGEIGGDAVPPVPPLQGA